LSCKRRVGRAEALPLLAMAGGAGEQPALRIAPMVKREKLGRHGPGSLIRHGGVISGDRLTFVRAQLLGDPAHLRMIAPSIRVGFELALQIAKVQSGETRGAGAIAPSVKPVAGEAGVDCAGVGAAVRDHPTVLRKAIERGRLGRCATCQQGCGRQEKEIAHGVATYAALRLFPLAALLLAACKPAPEQRQFVATADAAHGKAVIERVGCGSCHAIPGVRWPQGKVGPDLDGLAERALIGGKLPNEPDVLAAYIRNAPALVPGSGMPAMPVTQAEARDIAAYLYEQGAR
jgi:cytochrome c2